ncbi:secreted protein [Candidatus Magnetobacterium bavaricum]|uniref:Secreted protein n=1 Tax=Candidatus Magnetobacterium bavaricum TaxID=29290 RepID=A0A0F3GYM7_9BACT|nr:secreted protein [Candidatus Magnetobacterium bavaricum]
MQRRRILTLFLVLGMVVVYSCGGGSGPGSPGSSNTGNIGGYVTITDISHSSPKGDQGDGWQIDMVQDMCSGGTAEVWGDDTANLTVSLNSYDKKIPANTIFIQRYTVEYTQQIYELDLPPVKMFDLTTTVMVQPDKSSPVNIVVMDAGTKQEYMKELNSEKYNPTRLAPYLYDMKITLYGVDSLGNTFNVPVHRTVSLADYNYC